MTSMLSSYWNTFRPIFVIFSLYLMGDAFYRWDGFSVYASFTEFIPSVAFITILWSIMAVITSALIWLLIRIIEWICFRIGLNLTFEHLLSSLVVFAILGASTWVIKRQFIHFNATLQIKIIIILCIAIISILVILPNRTKAERWFCIFQERITPLVWLFIILSILSVPITSYHIFLKRTDDVISQKNIESLNVPKDSPNILLVTFDAFTAQNMSLYGYQRETTPFISQWSQKATVFNSVEASSNFTTSTVASLMTGKRLWSHYVYNYEDNEIFRSDESIPAVLKNNGYYNMAFIANPYASVHRLGILKHFDIAPDPEEFRIPMTLAGHIEVLFDQLFGKKIKLHNWILQSDFILHRLLTISYQDEATEYPVENAFNRFLATVDNNMQKPFFAWIHVYPPHDAYLPPEPFRGLFNPSSEFRNFKDQDDLIVEYTQKYSFKMETYPEKIQPAVDLFRDYYDEFIRYCDNEFKNFIAQIDKRDELKNTIIILSSDHGESFDHGYLTHSGNFLYEQVTHVPLIIRTPDQKNKGRIINNLVEQIDIPSTILDLANIPLPSWMEGRSLAPFIRGENLQPKPAFSMNFLGGNEENHIKKGTIAIWEGDYKLIHYLNLSKKNMSQLFNLKQDPDEIINLFNKETDVSRHLLSVMQNNLKKADVSHHLPSAIQSDLEELETINR